VSSYNKAKGTRWETDLENYLNECGLHARRLPRAGAKDIGDLSITIGDFVIVVEAKNVKAANMSDFLKQADIESDNYEEKYGVPTVPVVAVKARQKGTGEGRITMTLETFVDLLRLGGLT
jgi:Holliday junction resolvase